MEARVEEFLKILVKVAQRRSTLRRQKQQQQQPRNKNNGDTTTIEPFAIDMSSKLVKHSRYCLTTLAHKQASLQIALQVLGRDVWPTLVQGILRGRNNNNNNHNHAKNENPQSSSSNSYSRNRPQDKTTPMADVVYNNNPNNDDAKMLQMIILPSEVPLALEHVFTQLLRLHDGLILLVSGECRHVADRKALPFATRLTTQMDATTSVAATTATTTTTLRADGYTQLYKSTLTYSGASMDEWNDERNGLQKAWQNVLGGGTQYWDTLLEKYMPLDALLTDLETNMQQLQQEFLDLRTRIQDDLQQRLFPQGRVKLSWADQMERLAIDPWWSWERRGKTFQWKHPLGILPATWTRRDWQQSLAWFPPSSSAAAASSSSKSVVASAHPSLCNTGTTKIHNRPIPSKRRRVIMDDDDDDDDENHDQKPSLSTAIKPTKQDKHPPVGTRGTSLAEGLKVTTHRPSQSRQPGVEHTADPYYSSLNQIKAQLGVNGQALQDAREGLEAEEAQTRSMAQAIDQDGMNTHHEDDAIITTASIQLGTGEESSQYDTTTTAAAMIKEEMIQRQASIRRVAALTKQLQRILKKQGTFAADMYDVWDARECLRQAIMEAGNLHLWSVSSTRDDASSEDHRLARLRQADEYFIQAAQLVKAQMELHGRMVAKTGATEELDMCRRNLLLLLAQALVNRGISLVEVGNRTKSVDAVKHLEESIKECRALQKLAGLDRQNGASVLETTLDTLRAHETETLARRWKAEALWNLGKKNEAVEAFSSGGMTPNIQSNDGLSSAEIALQADEEICRSFLLGRTEAYYAWARLVDLVVQDAHKLPPAKLLDQSSSSSCNKWSWIQDTLKTAFAGAIGCVGEIERFLSSPNKCGKTLQSFLCDNDVVNTQELMETEKSLLDDLTKRREAAMKSLIREDNKNSGVHGLPRSEISGAEWASDPTSRWLLTGSGHFNEDRHRRHRRKRYGAGYSNIRVSEPVGEGEDAAPAPKQQFRPWGDDFFPKKKMMNEDGKEELVPDLPYPYCAPEMPPHIRSILEQRGLVQP